MNISIMLIKTATRVRARCGPIGLLVAAMAIAIGGAGCSDDGAGNGEAGDGLAPTVAVAFPPAQSLTDAATITVRGRADDVDGVAEIRVNGSPATSDNDFANWRANVALVHGPNAIIIESEDIYGNVETQAAEVTVVQSANWLDVPTAVAADSTNGRALVLDRVLDALLSIDYATGERVILSDDNLGDGPNFNNPVALVYNADNNRSLVLDSTELAVMAVDMATGARSILSDVATGAGPDFVDPYALAVNAAADRAWVLDIDETDPVNPIPVIVEVDLVTGDRSIVENAMGERPALVEPTAIALDSGEQALFVAATDDTTDPLNPVPVVYTLDLATVALTILSGDDPVILEQPTALAVNPDVDSNLLYLLDRGSDSIVSVDITTGVRAIITRDGVNAGREFSVPVAIAVERVDAATTRALVIDTGIDSLLGVDIATGTRTVLSDVSIGEGPLLARPTAMVVDALDGSPGRALVIDTQDDELVAVDMSTGARAIVSAAETGAGDPFANPVALALDVAVGLDGQTEPATRAFVVDEGADAIVEVDLASGNRTELSGPNAGAGDQLQAPSAVVYQPGDMDLGTPPRLLVSDESGAVYAIDLATGDRTPLTDSDPGSGPVLDTPRAMTLELGELDFTGRLLVADENPPALIAVDLSDGLRTEVSGQGTGDGANLERPTSVVIEMAPRPPVEPMEGVPPPPKYMATGYALAVHEGESSLIAIELDNGRRTDLYNIDDGRGPSLETPESLALDPQNLRMTLSDPGMDGILVLDLLTGERVLLSR